MIYLAAHYQEGYCRISDIAEHENIPKKYLEQLLLTLNRSGYLTSRKGVEGGYRLAKSPKEISLAEIVRLMDGALAPVYSVSKYFYEHTPIERSQKLLKLFREIRDFIANKMESTTLDQLLPDGDSHQH